MKRVNFHLKEQQIEGLRALSTKMQVSIAEIIRCAVDKYLTKTGKASYQIPQNYAILKTALKAIAKERYCLGPGCPYCEDGNGENHPFSNAAQLAQSALSKIDEFVIQVPIRSSSEQQECGL